jgi:hypothetical protein
MPDSGSSHENLGRTRLVGWVSLIALAVVALGLFVGCTVVLPRYLASGDLDHAKVTPTELAQARNDVRTTLLQGLGGLVLLIGAYLTWHQTQLSRAASRDVLRLAREGQLTDRFTHAVEQLGSDNVAVRVGGIYALGRIAEESITDRAAIADLLTAYARKHAPWPPYSQSRFPADHPLDQLPHLSVRAPDVQAS